VAGTDGRPLPGGEQIGEVLVGEHLGSVPGQEREHAAGWDQVTYQRRRVEKLQIRTFYSCI